MSLEHLLVSNFILFFFEKYKTNYSTTISTKNIFHQRSVSLKDPILNNAHDKGQVII